MLQEYRTEPQISIEWAEQKRDSPNILRLNNTIIPLIKNSSSQNLTSNISQDGISTCMKSNDVQDRQKRLDFVVHIIKWQRIWFLICCSASCQRSSAQNSVWHTFVCFPSSYFSPHAWQEIKKARREFRLWPGQFVTWMNVIVSDVVDLSIYYYPCVLCCGMLRYFLFRVVLNFSILCSAPWVCAPGVHLTFLLWL